FPVHRASIVGGRNDKTNNAHDNFCSGSYGAKRFRLDSERREVPPGRGRGQSRSAHPRIARVARRVEVPGRGLEPLRISPPDPKSGASANFATLASSFVPVIYNYNVFSTDMAC